MLKRKIVKHGPSSLTISLPMKWVKKQGLKAGDDIDVEESEQGIMIQNNEPVAQKREIIFHLEKEQDFMLRLLCGPYLKGYTTIKIYYNDAKIYNKIQEGVRYLIGFEIVEQGKDYVKLEEISQSSEEKFINIIHRLFFMHKSFTDDVQNFLKEPTGNIDPLMDIELTFDRLNLYCRRLLNKNMIIKQTYDINSLYHIVCLLEQSNDELRKIVQFAGKRKKINYEKKLDESFDKIRAAIDITLKKLNNYLGERDYKLQIDLAKEQKNIREWVKENAEEYIGSSRETAYIYARLAAISESIQHMSEELF